MDKETSEKVVEKAAREIEKETGQKYDKAIKQSVAWLLRR